MTRLPLAERQQAFFVRQRARHTMLDRLLQPAPAQPLSPAALFHRRTGLVVKGLILAMLLAAGLIALQTVTFEVPASVVEALLPRL